MPLLGRITRTRSPSMPTMDNTNLHYSKVNGGSIFLQVPGGKQERSQSLDMTGKNHLAGARRKLFRSKPSSSQSNISPSSSCMSSEIELSVLGVDKPKRKLKKLPTKAKASHCHHCDVVAEARRRKRLASFELPELPASSFDNDSSSGTDMSVDEETGQNGADGESAAKSVPCKPLLMIAKPSVDDGAASDYSSRSSSHSRRSSYVALSRYNSSSAELTPSPHKFSPQYSNSTPCLEFTYPPQISVESKSGYMTSVSRQSSVDMSGDSERRPRPIKSSPYISSSLSSPSEDHELGHELGLDGLQVSSATNLNDAHNYSNPRRRAVRRKTHSPRLYTNALTLHVPSVEPVNDKESEKDYKYRRASFDDRLLSEYQKLHLNSPQSSKEAVVKSEPSSPNKKPPAFTSNQSKAVFELLENSSLDRIDPGFNRFEDSSNVDWTENAKQGSHMWTEYPSGETCHDTDCALGQRQGARKKCSACHVTVHVECLRHLEMSAQCKPTFREAGVRNYREQSKVPHHWIHKKRQDGRCKECMKSFPQRNFPFHSSSKDVVAICCSWCQSAYHSKTPCFQMEQVEEECTLGDFANVIIPPSWIIKISRKLAFKSSVKKFTKKRSRRGAKRAPVDPSKFEVAHDFKPFIIKPMPTSNKKPLIVFVNPRSGGNQGARLIQKFNFYLNPRQVFDLNNGGPRKGLELYKKVPNLHVLVCGGDGTAGWVLSEIDNVGFSEPPSVAVLPLGTGNDLARTLNWGSGYTDEPIAKVLQQIEDSQITQLDRWDLSSYPTGVRDASPSIEDKEVSDKLPISVMNNYFSLGADAHALLCFHESREANPDKFNSRIKNKMVIASAGGMDMLKRPWRTLTDHIKIECDGEDYTARVKELKIHCLVFLNIPKYSSGTTPWGSSSQFENPRTDDGKIEVLGMSATQLAALQVGGHGDRIAQCNEVKLTTLKTIPMQVDGEPCRLKPSVITIKLRNRARMLSKQKRPSHLQPTSLKDISLDTNRMRLQVSRIGLTEYEKYHYNKDKLKEISVPLGMIVVQKDADLEFVRGQINRLGKEMLGSIISPEAAESAESSAGVDTEQACPVSFRPLAPNWCFLDSATAPRFFRIDRGQENVHFITDISSEDLYILDPELTQEISEPVQDESELRKLKTSASVVTEYKYPVTPPRSPVELQEDVNAIEVSTDNNNEPSVHTDNRISLRSKVMLDASKRGDLKRFCEAHREGADMSKTDADGLTVLHNVARFNNKDVCQYILQNAPLKFIDTLDREKGQSALHKAAWYQRRTICRMLIQAGANVLLQDAQGMTPRRQALRAQDHELAQFLEYHELLQQTESASTDV